MNKLFSQNELTKMTDIELIEIIQISVKKSKNKEVITRQEDRNAQAAKWVLLQKYNKLVIATARSKNLFSDFSSSVDMDDLIAEVQIGFMEAVERYNTQIPSALGIFCKPYIKDRLKKYLKVNTHMVSPTKSVKMNAAFKTIIEMKDKPQEQVYAALRESGNLSDFEISQLYFTAVQKNNYVSVNDSDEMGTDGKLSSEDFMTREEYMGDAYNAESELLNAQRQNVMQVAIGNVMSIINQDVADAFLLYKGFNRDLTESDKDYTLADLTHYLFNKGITGDKNGTMTPQNLCLMFKKIERLLKEEMDQMFEVSSLEDIMN